MDIRRVMSDLWDSYSEPTRIRQRERQGYEVVVGRYVLIYQVRVGVLAMPQSKPTACCLTVLVDRQKVEKRSLRQWIERLDYDKDQPPPKDYDEVCSSIALMYTFEGNLSEYVIRSDWSVTQDYT